MAQRDASKLDRVVAEARAAADKRAEGYREQALKIYPWICGRCAREFTHANVRELTVHHRDHNHNNNPSDGSNWELLCLYCHDNEHQKQLELEAGGAAGRTRRSGMARLLPWLCAPLLASCIVVPRTVEVYDPDCRVVARHMDLQTVQVGYISGCANEGCAALIVAAAATVAASAIVSGSIVVIGNTVYWFEKQGRCLSRTSESGVASRHD